MSQRLLECFYHSALLSELSKQRLLARWSELLGPAATARVIVPLRYFVATNM
jgi:hypothetical protein